MPLAEVNGINIYYEIHGKGTPLVLISGFGVDHTTWERMIPPLAAEYQVIVFDNRGIGQSTIPLNAFTMTQMSEDVAKLLELLGIQEAHVFGHSMGGAIAQQFALTHPQRIKKLILSNTFTKLNTVPSFAFQAALALLEEGVPRLSVVKTMIPWIFSSSFLESPQNLQNYFEYYQKNPYPQPVMGFRRQGEALKVFDSRTIVHKISHPTLVIASDKDIISPMSNSEELKQKIPNASLKIIEGAGHALQVERPELLTTLILDFLE